MLGRIWFSLRFVSRFCFWGKLEVQNFQKKYPLVNTKRTKGYVVVPRCFDFTFLKSVKIGKQAIEHCANVKRAG